MLHPLILLATLAHLVTSQQPGTLVPETPPALPWKSCIGNSTCTSVSGKVTLDANFRWAHIAGGWRACFNGNAWDPAICPDNQSCAQNCELEGIDYPSNGITTTRSSIQLKLRSPQAFGPKFGTRVFLLDTATRYKKFDLVNKEMRFDVDVSAVPCGIKASLKLVAMDGDGGVERGNWVAGKPGNAAGAKFGTGYCDASCSRREKFIGGRANAEGWQPSHNDPNSGAGNLGSCCPEIEIFSGNAFATTLTPHPCRDAHATVCSGLSCGDGSNSIIPSPCDVDGCDLNPYRLGSRTFYGPRQTIDTTKKFTVVTQFIGEPIREIRRFYVQNNITIPSSSPSSNILTSTSCTAQKALFQEPDTFSTLGGLQSLTAAFKAGGGMVLALSIDDDLEEGGNRKLDGSFPVDADPGMPGVARGPCVSGGAQVPDVGVEERVVFGEVVVGDVGRTG